jgi:hypothetical protein
MRFVASTILSVAILAFVAQSVSAVPAGSAKNVDEVNQESNVLLKRNRMYNIGTFVLIMLVILMLRIII